MCVCATFFKPVICWWELGCFHSLAIVSSAAMNTGVHVPFLIRVFTFWGYMPRNGIAVARTRGPRSQRVASCIERVSYFTVFPSRAFLISNHGAWKYGRKWWPSAVVVSLKQSNKTSRTWVKLLEKREPRKGESDFQHAIFALVHFYVFYVFSL